MERAIDARSQSPTSTAAARSPDSMNTASDCRNAGRIPETPVSRRGVHCPWTTFHPRLWLIAAVLLVAAGLGRAAAPVVTNVHASQAGPAQPVTIFYNLQDADSATVRVSLLVSEDGGGTWNVPAQSLSGFGFGVSVAPGNDRYILWNAPADWPGHKSSLARFRVVVNDDPIPAGMELIPAGSFQMGNSTNSAEGYADELPVHTVYVSAFYMDRYEVPKALWDEVRAWGLTNGYTDLPQGSYSGSTNYSKGANHPVHYVSWYDVVKWSNARSERDNLMAVYYTNDAQTVVYKTGIAQVTNAQVKWSANGYRLPTEAEWEKAARGGLSAQRFPWGATVSHSQANYYVWSSNGTTNYYDYDLSPTHGFHPTFAVFPYTSPVGYFASNGYGLYDMIGNVWEWCWEGWNSTYYSSSPGSDPQGSPMGFYAVLRGGSWNDHAPICRAAFRLKSIRPHESASNFGFRCVRR